MLFMGESPWRRKFSSSISTSTPHHTNGYESQPIPGRNPRVAKMPSAARNIPMPMRMSLHLHYTSAGEKKLCLKMTRGAGTASLHPFSTPDRCDVLAPRCRIRCSDPRPEHHEHGQREQHMGPVSDIDGPSAELHQGPRCDQDGRPYPSRHRGPPFHIHISLKQPSVNPASIPPLPHPPSTPSTTSLKTGVCRDVVDRAGLSSLLSAADGFQILIHRELKRQDLQELRLDRFLFLRGLGGV